MKDALFRAVQCAYETVRPLGDEIADYSSYAEKFMKSFSSAATVQPISYYLIHRLVRKTLPHELTVQEATMKSVEMIAHLIYYGERP